MFSVNLAVIAMLMTPFAFGDSVSAASVGVLALSSNENVLLADSHALDKAAGREFVTTAIATIAVDRQEVSPTKRQGGLLRRAMHARYLYTCPIGGSDERDFKWEAEYVFNQKRLYIRGFHLIDSIDDIVKDKQDFSTFWRHTTCIWHLDKVCYYAFRGHTFGHVTHDSLTLHLTTDEDDQIVKPYVMESCVKLDRLPGGFCTIGFNHEEPKYCTIDDIEAYNV